MVAISRCAHSKCYAPALHPYPYFEGRQYRLPGRPNVCTLISVESQLVPDRPLDHGRGGGESRAGERNRPHLQQC